MSRDLRITTILKDFVDIHLHILAGLDDGPKHMSQSIEIARCYERVGVKMVIATPHYLPGTAWAASTQMVVEAVRKLQEAVKRENIDLSILPGMEIAHHNKMKERVRANELLSLGGSGYYLIEPSFHGSQDELLGDCTSLLKAGCKLILAHPERVRVFQQSPQLLGEMAEKGMLLQVTIGSLLGHFGRRAKKLAEELVARGRVDFIASDAHNSTSRPPITESDWEHLLSLSYGDELLEKCTKNTRQMLSR